jgi:hypothetical protein
MPGPGAPADGSVTHGSSKCVPQPTKVPITGSAEEGPYPRADAVAHGVPLWGVAPPSAEDLGAPPIPERPPPGHRHPRDLASAGGVPYSA